MKNDVNVRISFHARKKIKTAALLKDMSMKEFIEGWADKLTKS